MSEYKPLHELSREEFFNNPEHVRSTMPVKHHVKYEYTNPSGAGPFKGSHYYDHPVAKGDIVQGLMGKARALSKSRPVVPEADNMKLFEHGKKVHREAVEKAYKEGKHISPHVLADYPHLTGSQHTEVDQPEGEQFDPEEVIARGPKNHFRPEHR